MKSKHPNLTDIEFQPGNIAKVLVCGNGIWHYNSSTNIWSNNLSMFLSHSVAIDTNYGRMRLCNPLLANSTPNDYIYLIYDLNATPGFLAIDKIKGTDLPAGNWIVQCTATFDNHNSIFEVSPTDADVVYIESGNPGREVCKSINASSGTACFRNMTEYYPYNTNFNISTHADIRSMVLLQGSAVNDGLDDKVLVGSDGGILYCENWTNKSPTVCPGQYQSPVWKEKNGKGLNITQFYRLGGTEDDTDEIVAGAQDNGFYRYSHGAWFCKTAGDGYDALINPINENFSAFRSQSSLQYTGIHPLPISNLTNISNCNSAGLHPMAMEYEETDSFLSNCTFKVKKYPNSLAGSGVEHHDFKDILNPNYVIAKEGISAFATTPADTNYLYLAFGSPTWNKDLADCYLNGIYIDCGTYCTTGICLDQKLFVSTNGGSDFTDITWTLDPDAQLGGDDGPRWMKITSIVADRENPNQFWISYGNFDVSNPTSPRRVMGGLLNPSTMEVNWIDQSAGLPNYPVEVLKYQGGTDDVIYAGTDAGVFVWNKSNGAWECFANNLPKGLIWDLEISHCGQMLRASVFGRGIWESPLVSSNMVSLDIAANSTWSDPKDIITDIEIEPNVALTITGTVNMARGRQIKVKRGATLIVDGGTITNKCGRMWGGIVLQGKGTSLQAGVSTVNDANHGTVYLKNGALIEHADVGITAGVDGNQAEAGGRVFATSSTIQDCGKGIEFLPFNKTNVSYVKECNFINTTHLRDTNAIDAYGRKLGTSDHIRLVQVKDIRIEGNTFENTGSFYPDIRGTGISSMDASYTVARKCTTWTGNDCVSGIPNRFIGLTRGVKAHSGNMASPVNIHHNEFDNVQAGISIVGSSFCSVKDNQIINLPGNLWNPPGTTGNYYTWGIVSIGGGGTIVNGNEVNSLSLGPTPVGVYAMHSWYSGLEVIRNEFFGDQRGIQAQLWNQAMRTWCNEVEDGYALVVTSGYFPNQGMCDPSFQDDKLPAGNDFNNTTSFYPETDIYFHGAMNPNPVFPINRIEYRHHDTTNSIYNVYPFNHTTTGVNGEGVDLFQCQEKKSATSCDDPYEGKSNGQLVQKIATLDLDILEVLGNIDGGNTEAVLNYIHPNSGHSSAQIREYVHNRIPLSDTVLKAAETRNPALNDQDLTDILIENSMLPPGVYSLIPANLPHAMLDSIDSAQSNPSQLRSVLVDAEWLLMTRRHTINEIVRRNLDSNNVQGAVQFLDSLGDLISLMASIPLEIADSNYSFALSKLDTLNLTDPSQRTFKDLMGIVIALDTSDRGYAEITESEEEALREIAADSMPASEAARAILEIAFAETYVERIDSLEFSGFKRLESKNREDFAPHEKSLIDLPVLGAYHPHPAYENVNILYYLPEMIAGAVIQIREILTGKILYQSGVLESGSRETQIKISGCPPGVYVYSLTAEGVQFDSRKMVIIR